MKLLLAIVSRHEMSTAESHTGLGRVDNQFHLLF